MSAPAASGEVEVAYTATINKDRVPDLNDEYDKVVRFIAEALTAFLRKTDCPEIAVTIVLVPIDEFTAAVQEALDASGSTSPPFTTERLGGQVLGKNIPVDDDHARVRIVLACPTPAESVTALAVFLLAHEMVHPVLNRLRAASGTAADETVLPPPIQTAGSMIRTVMDEYRADRVASLLLQGLTRAPERPDGIHQADLMGTSYVETFAEVLDEKVWPGWPDVVEDYRHGRTNLDAMWERIASDTDQVLTLLAHAQACADEGDEGDEDLDPFAGDRGGHRASELYLEQVWSVVMAALDAQSLIPTLADFMAAERAVCEAGEAALVAMWERLGLTFGAADDRSFNLYVDEPQR